MTNDSRILTLINSAPALPGCYLFKDKSGVVLYVGKAKNIRKRVRQYFYRNEERWSKLDNLLKNFRDLEFITLPTELDALLLEHRLIKRYMPRYNSQLKAKAGVAWIRVNLDAEYPGVAIGEDPDAGEGERRYGFFRDRYAAEDTAALLNKVWGSPLCGKAAFTGKGAPCLQYHLGNCPAPCGGLIEREAYRRIILGIVDFFEGRDDSRLLELEKRMDEASQSLRYEEAGRCYQALQSLEKLKRRRGRTLDPRRAARLALFIRPYRSPEWTVFYIQRGQVYCRYDSLYTPEIGASGLARAEGSADNAMRQFREVRLKAREPLPDSEWMVMAAGEIYADKWYIILPEEESPDLDDELILRGYGAFLGTR